MSEDYEKRLPVEEFRERCRREGIPFTVQRRKVYEALLGCRDHPTADRIFEEVRGELPGISRMTVYRVLELLVRFDLARKVCHPGASTRYDPNHRPHHHLLCTRCERLIDFEENTLDSLPPPEEATRLAFEVSGHTVQFRGLCAECRKRNRLRES